MFSVLLLNSFSIQYRPDRQKYSKYLELRATEKGLYRSLHSELTARYMKHEFFKSISILATCPCTQIMIFFSLKKTTKSKLSQTL